MKNADPILILIENDIISSKLINTFKDIGIDATLYQIDIADLVFDLLEISPKNRTASLYKKYDWLINQGKKIDFVTHKEQITEQAQDIYTYLRQFKN